MNILPSFPNKTTSSNQGTELASNTNKVAVSSACTPKIGRMALGAMALLAVVGGGYTASTWLGRSSPVEFGPELPAQKGLTYYEIKNLLKDIFSTSNSLLNNTVPSTCNPNTYNSANIKALVVYNPGHKPVNNYNNLFVNEFCDNPYYNNDPFIIPSLTKPTGLNKPKMQLLNKTIDLSENFSKEEENIREHALSELVSPIPLVSDFLFNKMVNNLNFEGITKQELKKLFNLPPRQLTADSARIDLYDTQVKSISQVGMHALKLLGKRYCGAIAEACFNTRHALRVYTRTSGPENAQEAAEYMDEWRFNNKTGVTYKELVAANNTCHKIIEKSGRPNGEVNAFGAGVASIKNIWIRHALTDMGLCVTNGLKCLEKTITAIVPVVVVKGIDIGTLYTARQFAYHFFTTPVLPLVPDALDAAVLVATNVVQLIPDAVNTIGQDLTPQRNPVVYDSLGTDADIAQKAMNVEFNRLQSLELAAAAVQHDNKLSRKAKKAVSRQRQVWLDITRICAEKTKAFNKYQSEFQ